MNISNVRFHTHEMDKIMQGIAKNDYHFMEMMKIKIKSFSKKKEMIEKERRNKQLQRVSQVERLRMDFEMQNPMVRNGMMSTKSPKKERVFIDAMENRNKSDHFHNKNDNLKSFKNSPHKTQNKMQNIVTLPKITDNRKEQLSSTVKILISKDEPQVSKEKIIIKIQENKIIPKPSRLKKTNSKVNVISMSHIPNENKNMTNIHTYNTFEVIRNKIICFNEKILNKQPNRENAHKLFVC